MKFHTAWQERLHKTEMRSHLSQKKITVEFELTENNSFSIQKITVFHKIFLHLFHRFCVVQKRLVSIDENSRTRYLQMKSYCIK